MLQTCISCGNLKVWLEICQSKLEGDYQFIISYQQWQTSEDSGHLEKVKLERAVTDVFDTISVKLEHFLFNDFVKNSHFLLFNDKKETLDSKSIIILFDFSENYEFIFQDEIQSAYWDTSPVLDSQLQFITRTMNWNTTHMFLYQIISIVISMLLLSF